MTTFYTLDRANERLREVQPILEDLRARRSELVGLRDRLHAASLAEVPDGASGSLVDDALTDAAGAGGPGSGRVLAARIQAVIDQMQAAVERLDAWDVMLRDIEAGLIDFPALLAGRQVWLCWRLGEGDVAWWHELAAGDVVEPAGRRAGGVLPAARVVDPRGRAKVLRPLPAEEREAAVARGFAAYARGDFYLAHEELEPAWMAAAEPGDRELLGGLIKLAAAFVHAARGNPAGATTNLRGARERLAGAAAAGRDGGLDLPGLLAAIDDRLARIAALPETPVAPVPDPPHDVAGPPGRARRPALALEPPALVRKSHA